MYLDARGLARELRAFPGDAEVSVRVFLPSIEYCVTELSLELSYDPDGDGLTIDVEFPEGQLDFPAVLRRLKDWVASIPEWACDPPSGRRA